MESWRKSITKPRTKFVAANSLTGISKPKQMSLRNEAIDEKE